MRKPNEDTTVQQATSQKQIRFRLFCHELNMILTELEMLKRVSAIRILFSDVDGILTDGRLIYGPNQVETKEFNVRDGLAVKLWRGCGYRFGLITARESDAVARRASELSVDHLIQKQPHKLEAIVETIKPLGLSLEEVCYIGDDLHDLSAVKAVGLGATVADAAREVIEVASFQTEAKGGFGALRELIETILKAKNEWAGAIQKFY